MKTTRFAHLPKRLAGLARLCCWRVDVNVKPGLGSRQTTAAHARAHASKGMITVAAKSLTLDEFRALAGTEVGVSDWIEVPQAKIDAFAEVTGDHQFIHVNPELARQTPFGTTIAHGYLTLSLLSVMAYQAMPGIKGTRMGVNYGLNKVRFMAPVKSGSKVRGRFTIADVSQRPDGAWQTTTTVTVEIEGETKPALAAEWITLQYVG